MKRLMPSTPSRYWRLMDSTQKARSTSWNPSREPSKAPRMPRETTKVTVVTRRVPHRQSMVRVSSGLGRATLSGPSPSSRRVMGVSSSRAAKPASGAQIVRDSQGKSLSI